MSIINLEDHPQLTRRSFLRGAGALIALPTLESLAPAPAAAQTARVAPLATTASGAPLRLAFVYFPNGAIQESWWPKGEGKELALNRTMEPLEKLKSQIQVIGGLDHQHATAGPDGPGDHARANGTFLTGVRVKKTAGADIRAGISIDQIAAQRVGHLTRFPSLELSCDAVRRSGSCDSGYSCAYQYNLSWRNPTTPVAPEPNPRLVFERLFGAGTAGERSKNYQLRQQQQRSVLDFVLDDARALQRQLGVRDLQKLDEYLTSVREIEQRIQRAERFGKTPDPAVETPAGVPAHYAEYLQIMFGMLHLAFQTDSTRVATLLLAADGANRTFPEIGIIEGHHYLTHHRRDAKMMEKVAQIDRFFMQQFAAFLEKLEQTRDVDGRSLLHNSMIVYGGGIADGDRHTHHNLPIVLAGGGGGTLTPGRYPQLSAQPCANLFLSLVERMGITDLTRFGDASGRVTGI